METIFPAQLHFNVDGMIHSSQFDDIYHSQQGGISQSKQVFMAGNGLPERWKNGKNFVILETGFGIGLNFLTTCHEWKKIAQPLQILHFISIEKHPFSKENLKRIYKNYPEFQSLSDRLIENLPCLCSGVYRIEFFENIRLTLIFGDAAYWLKKIDAEVDAFYLDGFSPAKNPEMWSEDVFLGIAQRARHLSTLATYTVAGFVRRGLEAVGFSVHKEQGFGHKKQRLSAIFQPRRPKRHHTAKQKCAFVIGAGLAGCATAERLAARGWHVTLIERGAQLACGASGNHAGIFQPVLSRDDNVLSRVSRAGFFYLRQHLKRLQAIDLIDKFDFCGVLQLPRDDVHLQQFERIFAMNHYPNSLAKWVEAGEAKALSGIEIEGAAVWFELGGWVQPKALCQALIESHKEKIYLKTNTCVQMLQRDEAGRWVAFDEQGEEITRADYCILANAAAVNLLCGTQKLPILEQWRALSLFPEHRFAQRSVFCRRAYSLPNFDGVQVVGAVEADEFLGRHFNELSCFEQAHVHQKNEDTLIQDCAAFTKTMPWHAKNGRLCARPNTPDRLPMIGQIAAAHAKFDGAIERVAREAGLFCHTGLGARGLVFALLGGELLACRLNGEPLPVERDLLNALDPVRFRVRAGNSSST